MPLDFSTANYGIIDYWLGIFVLEARRKDGQPYPPNTLYNIITGIQRYYKNELKRVDLNLLDEKNHYFTSFRETLDSRMKELTEMGLIFAKGSDPVTEDDEKKLWETKVLNVDTAKGLSNCVFFIMEKFRTARRK